MGLNKINFRSDFLAIPELENNPLGERIVQAFFQDSQEVRQVRYFSYSKIYLKITNPEPHQLFFCSSPICTLFDN